MVTLSNIEDKKQVSLYFHIPFCTKKCSYCHFYVLPDRDPLKKNLMEGLKLEWEELSRTLSKKEFEKSEITTIYFGGGTPFLLGSQAIGEILSWVSDCKIPKKEGIEITLEANPENITKELMDEYAKVGINRVSIGVQTLDNPLLKKLGRLHSGRKALDSIYLTREVGIENISIDLMYDLPGQNLSSWENSLTQVVDLPITHLSLYNLTLEPHTLFFKNQELLKKELPDEETSLQMYKRALAILGQRFTQYEISAFSLSGYESKHNVGYWLGRTFFGLGPSAFSYHENRRFQNIANLSKYRKFLLEKKSPVDFEETLSKEARLRELFVINLRLLEGVDLRQFQKRHGELDEETKMTLKNLVKALFIKEEDNLFRLTDRGVLFYDTVAAELV